AGARAERAGEEREAAAAVEAFRAGREAPPADEEKPAAEGEEAAEAAEAEGEEEAAEAAEAAEEEEEEAEAPPPKPKYGRRWAGGILVGGTLAAAACVGVLVFKPDLAQSLRDTVAPLVGQDEPKKPAADAGAVKPRTTQPQTADVRELLRGADWSKEMPPINETNGDDRAARGEYLWMQFLSTTKPPYKADDAKIKQALADLQEAEKAGGATSREAAA